VAPGTATGRLPARPGANATPARRWLDERDKTSRFIERCLDQHEEEETQLKTKGAICWSATRCLTSYPVEV
jgi:hypothetical protein